MRARQLADLHHASSELAETHPRLQIEQFIAVADQGRLRFEPVPRTVK